MASEKCDMSKSDGNYFVIRGYMDGMIMGERSFDTQQEAEFYGKRMLEHLKNQYPKAKKIAVDIDSTVNHAPGPKIKTLASRPGAKDTMAVEDRFYFGKERFASNAEWTSDIERNALEWLYILNMAAAGDKSQTTRKKIKQTANDLLEAMARKNSSMSIKAIETAKSLKRSAEI